LRILQINKLYSPWIGGVEKVVQDIAENLGQKTDVKVLVCTPKGKGYKKVVNGVEVFYAGSLGIYLSTPISFSFPFLLRGLSSDRDILHFHLPFPLGVIAYLLARPRGKLVIWWHSDIVRQKKTLVLFKPFLIRFLKKADKIITATAQNIENSVFLRRFKDKCEVIPFGISTKQFQLNDGIKKKVENIHKEYGPRIVLFVGRLIYYKGIQFLVQAMRNVDAKLLIIGEGPLKYSMTNLARELSIENKIIFLGKVDSQDLPAYYHACKVFVLPSVVKTEAFGIVQLEAMACGKPVVNTAIPSGIPYVSIDKKTGITIPPGDINSLAEAINTLLDNEILREKYGRQALIRVQNYFTMEKMIEKVYQVYNTLLSE
jgi:glycosyltransferase involved in cell wall biosynthesis